MKAHLLALASISAVMTAAGVSDRLSAAPGAKPGTRIETLATTDQMIWNAVVAADGALFVAGPRWAGNGTTQLGIVRDGKIAPFPDESWNDWKPGDDPARKFVNINALHLDPQGLIWAVDTGSPTFGGDPLPGAAKLVAVDPASGTVRRVVPLPEDVALKGSYVDDIRFNGDHAYLTDAGRAGIIVLDLASGSTRRVLNDHPAALARPDRPIILDRKIVEGPDGKPVLVQSDPLEVSADGKYLYFGPLEGPWSKVPTQLLDDPTVSKETLAAAVQPFVDFPPMGGSVMDGEGNIYFSELSTNAIKRRSVDGSITTLVVDPRLHWVDAMFITPDGRLLMPAAQIDRVPLFNKGASRVRWPVAVFGITLPPVSK